MLKITVKGHPNLEALLKQKLDEFSDTTAKERIAALRCPVHNQTPTVTGSGPQWTVEACCEDMKTRVSEALGATER